MAQIIITIPDDKVQQFKDAMWLVKPPPQDWQGTDLAWVKEWATRRLKKAYKQGAKISSNDDIRFS
jgi:hypothetical protein